MVKRFMFSITSSGIGQTGKNPIVYVAGGTSYSVDTITDHGDGRYSVEIDPVTDDDAGNIVSQLYDIHWDGALKIEDKFVDLWIFKVTYEMTTDPETVTFASLSGQGVPTPIPSAFIPGASRIYTDAGAEIDRGVQIQSVTTTQFVLRLTEFGKGELPLKLDFVIIGG